MPYRAEISRTNPSCFLFLLDQSDSMSEPIANGKTSKAVGVADALNSLLQNLTMKCTKSAGILDYYYVGVLGYGGRRVGPALTGNLARKDLMPISLIASSPLRVEERVKRVSDGRGGYADRPYKLPIWIEPLWGGGTPMCAALVKAETLMSSWLKNHPNSFPPIVINISDGDPSDGDPQEIAAKLTSLCSSDGHLLFFNVVLSTENEKVVAFPSNQEQIEDEFARELFKISSPLTPYMCKVLADEGYQIAHGAKGLVIHADLSILIRFLDIGTRPADLR